MKKIWGGGCQKKMLGWRGGWPKKLCGWGYARGGPPRLSNGVSLMNNLLVFCRCCLVWYRASRSIYWRTVISKWRSWTRTRARALRGQHTPLILAVFVVRPSLTSGGSVNTCWSTQILNHSSVIIQDVAPASGWLKSCFWFSYWLICFYVRFLTVKRGDIVTSRCGFESSSLW